MSPRLSELEPRPTTSGSTAAPLSELHQLHDLIQTNLAAIQQHTTKLFTAQETDLLTAFHHKFNDLQQQLHTERQKQLDGSAHWVNRCQLLEVHRQQLLQEYNSLKASYERMEHENKVLRTQVQRYEQDQRYLIQQLYECKRSARTTNRIESRQVNNNNNSLTLTTLPQIQNNSSSDDNGDNAARALRDLQLHRPLTDMPRPRTNDSKPSHQPKYMSVSHNILQQYILENDARPKTSVRKLNTSHHDRARTTMQTNR